MSDVGSLAAWKPRFAQWVEESQPLFAEGKGPQAFAKYPWFETEGDPFTRLAKPASQKRFGLITTGGYSIAGEQEPFKPFPNFGDDAPEMRIIPTDVDTAKLRIDHPGYDHRFADEDRNANLPLTRLDEMVANGELGSVATDSVVLMGLIPNVAPLVERVIPAITERFESDSVEAALLVPS